ncbi:Lhr family helicase [Cellulomonas carbonis]|uniref:DEAD/DEAH box helicase n=1 Tax=Cellulomonas carbonis T26 TaxID=947969 RepID=A0A0A0BUS8_9CELL|nr:DEAD/DEAH box helicase [Cellulomonas carbonis]KGM12153.1 DEAD/DEAH box helicase [Cellulomonas carbonis T26]GGB97473.1 DEAD/DEAH box helicase [Cellulomonas carbonis]
MITRADEPAAADPLAGFSEPTRSWFAGAFEAPTAAQAGAWSAVAQGDHALVVAPTGSGKTLAAFLWSLDRLMVEPATDAATRCRVLYVSPLKALAADVERNLRSPLVGIRQAAARLGVAVPDVEVGVRTGDTPPQERRAFATRPPDILITTPESLFLVLTSAARAGLAGVRTVVLDEIHAVAGTKRGAHLAVSLERLDALLEQHGGPAQRIGLSATVRPVDAVARFLGGARAPADGGRRVAVVQPPATKRVEVEVVVPVPDLADLQAAGPAHDRATGDGLPASAPRGAPGGSGGPGASGGQPDLSGSAAGAPPRPSIWPHVEERVVDLVAGHRSTLVFTNSRRGAERLTARMNEVWAERQGVDVPDPGTLQPAQVQAQSGASAGVDGSDGAPVLARAHHGSMSRTERTRTESELKAGRLPAVVATSSLELGIDMGAVDLVVQVGSPPSVASGLQRVGRAGHQVGATSRGVVFPTFRGDLVPAAVIAARMRAGAIESLSVPQNPLDVLAQQVVAMVAVDDWTVEDLATVVRRAAPFTDLGEGTLRAVLDMLAGRYPSEEFGELRPRLVWDRSTGVLTGRPGALRLAVTSGGTIPDRGLYGVFLAGSTTEGDAQRGGRRVGELDEEMVYESRVGDTFTLGSSTWRIEDITPDRVLVSPAPGLPGRLPFWKGDSPGRPAELGKALGGWVRELVAADDATARAMLTAGGLDAWAADNLLGYVHEQADATGQVPDDRTIVVERFRDEIGDWRVVVHSPYGARVHAPWALVLAARLRDRYGLDAAALHADDGIVLRLPDVTTSGTWDVEAGRWVEDGDAPGVDLEDLLVDADEVAAAVRAELGSSALFAARFREAAARSLLLPRRRPDRRQPLWQQRQRAAQLLSVASRFPDFPVLLEAARECLQDDFDVAALSSLMADVAAHRVRVVEVTTPSPSPFAQSLLFGYTAQFLYDGDAPLAERRAAALTLDPTLLAELLGQGGSAQLADLLDPAAVERTEAELSGTAPDRRARHAEDVADAVRRHGPLTLDEVRARTREEHHDDVAAWLDDLTRARRLIAVRHGTTSWWAAIEDAGRLRDALGVALPVGVPEDFTEPVPDPLGDLVRRHARTHGPFTAAQVASRFGIGIGVATEVLRRLEGSRVLAFGHLRPASLGGTGEDYCDLEVLRILRRRSLAALRAEVEPVPARALGVFLPRWQGVASRTEPRGGRSGGRLRGVDGLLRAVEQLSGAALPASALETLVLPARVPDYDPAMLDELTSAGEVLWAGSGPLAARDGLVSLHLAATADLTLAAPADRGGGGPVDGPVHDAVLDVLASGGAFFLPAIVDRVRARLAEDASPPELGRGAGAVPDLRSGAGAVPDLAPGTTTGMTTLSADRVTEALWDLVWGGWVTNDGFAALRARLGSSRSGTTHRVPRHAPRGRALTRRALGGIALRPTRAAPLSADTPGRWSLLPEREQDPTVRAHALAAQLLDRHGVLTRAVAASEGIGGGFTAVYRVLSALEEAGQVRRGYFVEHLGGSQFALPGAVDQLRDDARDAVSAGTGTEDEVARADAADPPVVLLAATDPANPYGAALAWPDAPTTSDGDAGRHRPGRKAGSLVVLVAGRLVLYVERGGRTLLSFSTDPGELAHAAAELAATARTGRLGRLTVQRVDGSDVLDRATLDAPVASALAAAGFAATPRGLRLRDG